MATTIPRPVGGSMVGILRQMRTQMRTRLSYQRTLSSFSVLLLLVLFPFATLVISPVSSGKFHGYKKVFHREEHGDHKTYYDDLHHGKYKKSATDSREMFRQEKKDQDTEVGYGRTANAGSTRSESLVNPIVVDTAGRLQTDTVPATGSKPAGAGSIRSPATNRNSPRDLLWKEPPEFHVQFSSAFQDFVASLNSSAF